MRISSDGVNEICKRDHITAFAKQDVQIGEHKVEAGQSIKGSGHWSTETGIRMDVEEIGFDEVDRIDSLLLYDEWDFYVMVPFKRDENEG
jgi:hypothetical protein